jgi:DNA-binding transcriptional MerR regulator
MALPELYTVTQASKLVGASRASIRAYTLRPEYQRYLSTEATPQPGQERQFTRDDLKLLRFIFARTSQGETHEAIAARLNAGGLGEFEWSPPEPQQPAEHEEASTGMLVPVEQVRALQAILADARQRELETKEQSHAQLQALQEEVRQLTRELGEAQGELNARRRRRPTWWIRLFGE